MIEKSPLLKIDYNLLSLLQDEAIDREIKSINMSYFYWDKVKYIRVKHLKALEIWNLVKVTRKIQYKTIEFNQTKFNFCITDEIQTTLHELDMQLTGLANDKISIPDELKIKFHSNNLMDEAISSSIMEGATTTRAKAIDMLSKETRPVNKSDQMIVNNYKTINYIVDHKTELLTPERLLYIHQLISSETLEKKKDEGKFRDSNEIYVLNISTNEIVHIPPKNNGINNYIESLCDFFNNVDNNNYHPILKAIIIHFMIGWIHPFVDGNGRTARALFYWFMLKNFYPITEFLSISKVIQKSKIKYEKAFLYTEIDDNDMTYFITYHLKVLKKSIEEMQQYVLELKQENYNIIPFLKIPNINNRKAYILKNTYDDPTKIWTVKEVQKTLNISNFTAREDLTDLVNMGYLESINSNKVLKNYIRSKQFSTLLKDYLT